LSITLLILDTKWRNARGLGARLKHAAAEALSQGGGEADAALTILLTTDQHMRKLNLSFRGEEGATNVLSFPSSMGAKGYLGDIAIGYGMTTKEAKSAGKDIIDHATHLAVHGVLHLLGFDHGTARQAKIMEPLETKILKVLNVANPYGQEVA
jgi:probable rRNA maturation factor